MRIITFANQEFINLAINWTNHLKLLKLDNYVVYSLDDKTFDTLDSLNINTERVSGWNPKKGNPKWGERFLLFSKELEKGSFIHSDLDAIWLKDPSKFIDEKYDIIGSTGTFPHSIYKKIGFVICMGWVFFNDTKATKKLFSKITKKPFIHDQKKFNKILFKNSDITYNNHPEESFKIGDINLKVLNQDIVSRTKLRTDNTFIHHPRTKRSSEGLLKDLDLWIDDGIV